MTCNIFFQRLSYSFGNEDWRTERRALKILPTDRVLCITASGDRPMHVILEDCKEVVAVDANPVQNYLLALKIAAARQFDYHDYLAFLGAKEHDKRLAMLKNLYSRMQPEAANYWSSHQDCIEKGVLFEGAVERWTRKIARVLLYFRGKKIKKLFSFHDLEEQKKFIEKEWDTPCWKNFVTLALHPTISRIIFKDPGLYDNVDENLHPGKYIYHRMNASLMRYLARDNPFISLFLNGQVAPSAYPPYLTEAGFQTIKPRLNRICYITQDVINYLSNQPSESFDVFSVSDVASYISQSDFHRLVQEMYRTARPGARFSIREFLSKHKIPRHLQNKFKRDHTLEKELSEEDRCFVYRFMVGYIEK